MSLDEYLERQDITSAAFAERLGTSEASISRLRRGKQEPSMDLLKRIAEATGGLVMPNDFLPPTTPTPQPVSP